MATANAALGSVQGVVSVLPQPGDEQDLITTATLTQSLAVNISSVISVAQARLVEIILTYTPHASASGSYVMLLPMVSNARNRPATGDDVWRKIPVYDVSATEADIAAGVTLPTGADYSKASWRRVSAGGLLLSTLLTDASQPERIGFPVRVDSARWMYVAMCQQGDTTNFGTASLKWCVSL